MNWVFLALLAPFVYAINVFLDKYLISAKIPEYRSLPIFGVILAVPVFLILGLLTGFGSVSFKDAFLVLITGAITIWGFSLYLEALIKEDTSIVIILMQLVPAFVAVLSYFTLGETMNSRQFLGFILLLCSSVLISLRKEASGLKVSRGLIYILLADILWSLTYVLVKFASETISFTGLIMYESAGVILGGLLLLILIPAIKKAFTKTINNIKRSVLGLVLFNESLFLGGKIITYLAVVLGPAALVSVLGSTQLFFGVLLGTILTLLLPKVFKEDISRKALIKKVILGSIAFLGIILVS